MREAGVGIDVGRGGLRTIGHVRAIVVEPEVVEVEVAPTVGIGVHKPDEDVRAVEFAEVGGDPLQVLRLVAVGAEDHVAFVCQDDLDAGPLVRAAADEEASPRLVDREHGRRQRTA